MRRAALIGVTAIIAIAANVSAVVLLTAQRRMSEAPADASALAATFLFLASFVTILLVCARWPADPQRRMNGRASRRVEPIVGGEEERWCARADAQRRARELLRSHLSDEQRDDYDRSRSFVVAVPSGRRYRISHAWAFNVRDEADRTEYCVQFRRGLYGREIPIEDLMLGQKLLLECDEPRFLRTANKRTRSFLSGL
jgi:hypothetical protein